MDEPALTRHSVHRSRCKVSVNIAGYGRAHRKIPVQIRWAGFSFLAQTVKSIPSIVEQHSDISGWPLDEQVCPAPKENQRQDTEYAKANEENRKAAPRREKGQGAGRDG